jgi:hypothetical protein
LLLLPLLPQKALAVVVNVTVPAITAATNNFLFIILFSPK